MASPNAVQHVRGNSYCTIHGAAIDECQKGDEHRVALLQVLHDLFFYRSCRHRISKLLQLMGIYVRRKWSHRHVRSFPVLQVAHSRGVQDPVGVLPWLYHPAELHAYMAKEIALDGHVPRLGNERRHVRWP